MNPRGPYPPFSAAEQAPSTYNNNPSLPPAEGSPDSKSDGDDDSDSGKKRRSKKNRAMVTMTSNPAEELRMKRMKHNQDESVRRQKLKDAFNELAVLCSLESSDWKQHTILRAAINRMSELGTRVRTLEATTSTIATTVQHPGLLTTKLEKTEGGEKEEARKRDPLDVLNESNVPMEIVGVSGRMISCNQLFVDLLGYTSREELLQKHPSAFSLTHPGSLVSFFSILSGLLSATRPSIQRFNVQLIRLDGQSLEVNMTGWLAKDSNRNPKYIVFVVEADQCT